MVGLEDDAEEATVGKLENDYLRICVRSVSLHEKIEDKTFLLRGLHAAIYPVVLGLQQGPQICFSADEMNRFREFLDAVDKSTAVPLLLPILCLGNYSHENRSHILRQIILALHQLDVNRKVLAWKACFVTEEDINEKMFEMPPRHILNNFRSDELLQGTQWLIDNRSTCPPLAHAPLSVLIQEWHSFLPQNAPEKSASSMEKDFNTVLATAMHLQHNPAFKNSL